MANGSVPKRVASRAMMLAPLSEQVVSAIRFGF